MSKKTSEVDPVTARRGRGKALNIPERGVVLRLMGEAGPLVLMQHNTRGIRLTVKRSQMHTGTVLEIASGDVETLRSFVEAAARLVWGLEQAEQAGAPIIDPVPHESRSTHASATVQCVNETGAASLLALSKSTLSVWRQRGIGPQWARFGRAIRYRIADLEAFVADTMVDPKTGQQLRDLVDDGAKILRYLAEPRGAESIHDFENDGDGGDHG